MQVSAKLRKEEISLQESLAARLRELGLSSYAARSLVALLGNAPLSAGEICRATGMPDSKIYYALEELDKAGLVESQHGTPTLYKPQRFDQMISSLIRDEKEEHERRLHVVELFRKQAEPLAKARSEPTQIELAYVVKGKRNIIERMLGAIEESRREIVLLISNKGLLDAVAEGAVRARKRKVKVGIAVPPELKNSESLRTLDDVRTLECECNILIADSEKLVTASHLNREGGYAILTSDKSMIRMSREYFDNPSCCVKS